MLAIRLQQTGLPCAQVEMATSEKQLVGRKIWQPSSSGDHMVQLMYISSRVSIVEITEDIHLAPDCSLSACAWRRAVVQRDLSGPAEGASVEARAMLDFYNAVPE